MRHFLILFAALCGLLLTGCGSRPEGSERDRALDLLRAERDRSYSLTGPSLARYHAELDRFYDRTGTGILEFRAFCDSLFATGHYFPDLVRVYDREAVSDAYLERRADAALSAWRSPWAKDLSFEDFCTYLLPYRVGNEEPEEWWTELRDALGPVLDSLSRAEEATLEDFAAELNRRAPVPHNYDNYPKGKPSFSPSALMRMFGGSCDDYVSLLTFIGRTYGVPVASDFTPHWGNHSKGHSWGAIVRGDSTWHYMIGEPLYPARESPFVWRLSKAYRRMASPQRDYPGRGSRPGELPASLQDPGIRDVTRQYADVTELRIGHLRPEGRSRFVTLNVFDDRDWVPVAGARRRGGSVAFPDVGLNCVYLPMYYTAGRSVPAGWPLLLGADRSLRELRPDPQRPQEVRLTRKFMDLRARELADMMRGGRFELSERADFRDAYAVPVPDSVGLNFQTVLLPQDRRFRYLRYVPAAGSSGDIAEIEVYDARGGRLTGGRVIGSYVPWGQFHRMENAFDGNVLTYTAGDPAGSEMPWVGLDLGQAQVLEKFCYLPRSDDNFIREGEEYELYYWSGDGWTSLGRQTGSRATQELVYDRVPADALLLLRDHTKGKEERIFTYEDGKQLWW